MDLQFMSTSTVLVAWQINLFLRKPPIITSQNPNILNLLIQKRWINELTVHVHIDGGGDRPGEVGVGGLAGQPLSEEGPVDIVKRDLVPYCSVTQDMVRLVN